MAVSLVKNVAQNVLRKEGYCVSKSARSFRGALLVNGRYIGADLGEDEVAENEYLDDPGLWQEPNTGILMLRVNALRSDLMESAVWEPYWMNLSAVAAAEPYAWRSVDGDWAVVPQDHLASKPKVLTTIRESDATLLTALSPLPVGVSDLDFETRYNLVWSLESEENFYPNEAFSLIVRPYGISTDRAEAFMAIAFGGRWCLLLGMAGGAALFENTGTAEAQQWIRRRRIDYRQGGVDQTQEFQLTVIPWGIDAISFVFSQAAQGNPASGSDYKAAVSTSFLYETRKHGYDPSWNASMKQWVKTAAAKVSIAVRKDRYATSFAFIRGRYPEDGAGITIMGDVLPEATGTTPFCEPIGFFGQNRAGETAADAFLTKTSLVTGASFVNIDGTAWNSAEDTEFVMKTWLRPSDGLVYSPEVWSWELKVPAAYHSPGVDVDISDYWTKLAGRVSVEPDAGALEYRYRSDWDYRNLYKTDASIECVIDGVVVFEGEEVVSRPGFEGAFGRAAIGGAIRSVPVSTNDNEALDGWHYLNTTSVSHFLSLTGRSYGELIRQCFYQAGVPDADLEIDAVLDTIEVDGWETANDFKITSENVYAGDVLRLLVELYGVQGGGTCRDLRIVRRERKWKAFLAPVYDPEVEPTMVFYLDTFALPEADRSLVDEDRWAAGYFKAFRPPEWTVRKPRFNALRGYASRGTGDGADLLACFLAAHPSALEDPDFVEYQGRVSTRTFGVNELSSVSTMNELQRAIRRRYDLECRTVPVLVLDAEWQPAIDTDTFVMVVGSALQDVAEASVLQGDPVCYGAYRILEIAWQIDMDVLADAPVANAFGHGSSADSTARLASRRALYSLEYVGATASEVWPMFTDRLPLFGQP